MSILIGLWSFHLQFKGTENEKQKFIDNYLFFSLDEPGQRPGRGQQCSQCQPSNIK